jgi:hypothetical protein
VILTFVADGIFFATLRDTHKASREQLRRLDSQLKSMADSSAQTERSYPPLKISARRLRER